MDDTSFESYSLQTPTNRTDVHGMAHGESEVAQPQGIPGRRSSRDKLLAAYRGVAFEDEVPTWVSGSASSDCGELDSVSSAQSETWQVGNSGLQGDTVPHARKVRPHCAHKGGSAREVGGEMSTEPGDVFGQWQDVGVPKRMVVASASDEDDQSEDREGDEDVEPDELDTLGMDLLMFSDTPKHRLERTPKIY